MQMADVERVIICVYDEKNYHLYESWMQVYFPSATTPQRETGIG